MFSKNPYYSAGEMPFWKYFLTPDGISRVEDVTDLVFHMGLAEKMQDQDERERIDYFLKKEKAEEFLVHVRSMIGHKYLKLHWDSDKKGSRIYLDYVFKNDLITFKMMTGA